MKILVSNDDGVFAPGIRALVNELSSIAEIEVIAPDRNRSGSSNSLTLSNPIRVKKLDNGYFAVEGTPTDCVHLGLTGFLDPAPEIVVSGINEGANLGDDVLYSGTVAAAMEGRHLGFPAIAISLVGENLQYYDTAASIAKLLVNKLSNHTFPSKTIFNVNVPDLPLNEIRGLLVTRLGSRHGSEPLIRGVDPRGKEMFWIGPPGLEADAGEGTDFHAVKNRYVSITPLHLDMTQYKVFDQLSFWMEGVDWNL
jgi:5'-nucleotidase